VVPKAGSFPQKMNSEIATQQRVCLECGASCDSQVNFCKRKRCGVKIDREKENTMAIKPKDLNQKNSGYGFKQMRHAWEANLSLLSKLQDNYNLGAYDRVLRDGIETLKGHGIKSTANLSQMHEAHLATFYFLGKSYLGLGQTENAIACFHVVYSQHGFEKKMLSGPLDFSGLVARAGAELQDIAQEGIVNLTS
jgi:hypothetical protein